MAEPLGLIVFLLILVFLIALVVKDLFVKLVEVLPERRRTREGSDDGTKSRQFNPGTVIEATVLTSSRMAKIMMSATFVKLSLC